VQVFQREAADFGVQGVALGEDEFHRPLKAHRQRSVHHIVGGYTVVDPASRLADILGKVAHKRHHIVARLLLQFGNPREVEAGAFTNNSWRVGGNVAVVRQPLTDGNLDLQPRAELALLAPEVAHFGGGVTLDHLSTSSGVKIVSSSYRAKSSGLRVSIASI
jgi:hypothetical protein